MIDLSLWVPGCPWATPFPAQAQELMAGSRVAGRCGPAVGWVGESVASTPASHMWEELLTR